MRYLINRLKNAEVALIAGIILLYILLGWMGISCPIRFCTGISCAGCGMTRAWNALLHLNFAEAFCLHPLFWLPPVCLLVWFFSEKIPVRVYQGFWVGCCVLFLAVYILRMANPQDAVVTANFQNGCFFRAAQKIFSAFL